MLKFQEFRSGALIRSPRKQREGLGIQDVSHVPPGTGIGCKTDAL